MRRAVNDGYVLVTQRHDGFHSVLGREDVHAGLVCLNVAPCLMSLDVQRERSARWHALHNVRAAHCGAEIRAEPALTTPPFAQLVRHLAGRHFDNGLSCGRAPTWRAHLGANKEAATRRGREEL